MLTTYFALFQPWPEDALVAVATSYLEEVELTPEERPSCITLCKKFHNSVENESMQFLNELRRHVYVTPTSYLQLISTFKDLLSRKRVYVLKCYSHTVSFADLIKYFAMISMYSATVR